MNVEQKFLTQIYASFTNEKNVEVSEVYDKEKNLVTLRRPLKLMSDDMEAILYALVEYIEFEGDNKIVNSW